MSADSRSLASQPPSEAWAKAGYYAPILRPARREYQRGHVFLRGKRHGGTWVGRWRITEFSAQKRDYVRIRESVVLGTKDEIPTKELAMELLAAEMERTKKRQEEIYNLRKAERGKRPTPQPQDRHKAYLDRGFALIRKYGLTHDDVDRMIREQCGRCAVCNEPCRDFHIDHNHTNKQVRALLCGHCNSGLGMFRDRPNVLRAAADYIESHNL